MCIRFVSLKQIYTTSVETNGIVFRNCNVDNSRVAVMGFFTLCTDMWKLICRVNNPYTIEREQPQNNTDIERWFSFCVDQPKVL